MQQSVPERCWPNLPTIKTQASFTAGSSQSCEHHPHTQCAMPARPLPLPTCCSHGPTCRSLSSACPRPRPQVMYNARKMHRPQPVAQP